MAATRKTTPSPTPAPAGGGVRILWRPKLWAALALLAAMGYAGHLAWQRFAPTIAEHPQYQITVEQIHITPPPEWVRSDVRGEVFRDAGLAGTLSVLNDREQLYRRVREAFGFHPWVASVRSIKSNLPAGLEVELDYRRPVAAVESSDGTSVAILPIDAAGVRLPDADFSEFERRLLPRISGTTVRPQIGERWNDARVTNAAELAARLVDVWNQLRLVEIIPSSHVQVRGDAQFYTFDIITSGGTRIVWGSAPGREEEAAESPFDVKRERLLKYAADQGKLDSIDGPASIDVRSELVVSPRTARRPTAKPADKPATK
jgi:hypothetical protein